MAILRNEIIEFHSRLNKAAELPPMAFRRNSKTYELVSYVNHIVGCFISENYDPIAIFIERIKIYIDENDDESSKNYYQLINEYIFFLENFLNSNSASFDIN